MDKQLRRAMNSMHETLVHSAVVDNAVEDLTKADAIIVGRSGELRKSSKEVYSRLVTMQTNLAVYLARGPYVDRNRVQDEKRAIEEVKVQLGVISEEKKDLEIKSVQVIELRLGLDEEKVKHDAQLAAAKASIESRLGPVFSTNNGHAPQNQNQYATN